MRCSILFALAIIYLIQGSPSLRALIHFMSIKIFAGRGSQYCAHDYQKLLTQFGMTVSMSRKGDRWNNAPMESFWGTLKNKLVYQKQFATRQQSIQEITEYIEVFYNRQRKQAKLGYLSPATFTQQYYKALLAA